MILGGYFPKIVVPRPEWLAEPRVDEICSVSTCVSGGPDGWIDKWLHNMFGWFNTVADAWAVVPPEQVAQFRLFAYRLAPVFYHQGEPRPIEMPEDVHPEPLPDGCASLGFDTFNKSSSDVLGFECSPLSCNSMAHEFAVNRHCLVAKSDQGHAAAKRCSIEQPEPGDYYMAEVLEWQPRGRRTRG